MCIDYLIELIIISQLNKLINECHDMLNVCSYLATFRLSVMMML